MVRQTGSSEWSLAAGGTDCEERWHFTGMVTSLIMGEGHWPVHCPVTVTSCGMKGRVWTCSTDEWLRLLYVTCVFIYSYDVTVSSIGCHAYWSS